jgi:3-keto-5-aminohexanoate cleavage enzyme
MDKAILTCALTGVLTNPQAAPGAGHAGADGAEARDAFNAGASGHACAPAHAGTGPRPPAELGPGRGRGGGGAIRAACPGVIINLTTGVVGKDIVGPGGLPAPRAARDRGLQCRQPELPEDQGSDGRWAWPPMVFDNPVAKVQQILDVMRELRHPPRVRVLRRRHRALAWACT